MRSLRRKRKKIVETLKRWFNRLRGWSTAKNSDYINECLDIYGYRVQKDALDGFIESFAGKTQTEAYIHTAVRLCMRNLCEMVDVKCPVLKIIGRDDQITILASFPIRQALKPIAILSKKAGDRAARKIEFTERSNLWANGLDYDTAGAMLDKIEYPMFYALKYSGGRSSFIMGEFDCKYYENIFLCEFGQITRLKNEERYQRWVMGVALGMAFWPLGRERLTKIFTKAEFARKRAAIWGNLLMSLFCASIIFWPGDLNSVKEMFANWIGYTNAILANLPPKFRDWGIIDQLAIIVSGYYLLKSLLNLASSLINWLLQLLGFRSFYFRKAQKLVDDVEKGLPRNAEIVKAYEENDKKIARR